MAVNCDPNALEQAAACYKCIPTGTQREVMIFLLNQILGTGLTVQQLLNGAKCYKCIPTGQQDEVISFLLCQIANKVGA
jgi:hypothetical protein